MGRRVAAVIDIGSNSARLAIFEIDGDSIRELAGDKVMLRLAAAVNADGAIDDEAITRTVSAVERFVSAARAFDLVPAVVATSAVRDATNREAVLAAVEAACGERVRVRVLEGVDEARLAAIGALRRLGRRDGLVLDLGGGSLEVAAIRDGCWDRGGSWPLGALRSARRLLQSDPPTDAEIKALRREVRAALEAAAVPRLQRGEVLVGTGGNARALAKMIAGVDDSDRVHGHVVERSAIRRSARQLSRVSAQKRRQIAHLDPDRADSIHAGALIIDAVMEHLRARQMLVSDGGLRDGVILEAGATVDSPRNTERSGHGQEERQIEG